MLLHEFRDSVVFLISQSLRRHSRMILFEPAQIVKQSCFLQPLPVKAGVLRQDAKKIVKNLLHLRHMAPYMFRHLIFAVEPIDLIHGQRLFRQVTGPSDYPFTVVKFYFRHRSVRHRNLHHFLHGLSLNPAQKSPDHTAVGHGKNGLFFFCFVCLCQHRTDCFFKTIRRLKKRFPVGNHVMIQISASGVKFFWKLFPNFTKRSVFPDPEIDLPQSLKTPDICIKGSRDYLRAVHTAGKRTGINQRNRFEVFRKPLRCRPYLFFSPFRHRKICNTDVALLCRKLGLAVTDQYQFSHAVPPV